MGNGLLLVCSWPMPQELWAAYEHFREALRPSLPRCALLYTPSALHCTVATLAAWDRCDPALSSDGAAQLQTVWRPVLDTARRSPRWPTEVNLRPMKFRVGDSGVVFLTFEDDGSVRRMRSC